MREELNNFVPVPLNKVKDLNVIHTLDFKSYQYALEKEQYKALVGKGTVLSIVVLLRGQPIAFALWERGSKNKSAFIHRLGVLPRIVSVGLDGARNAVNIRRKGIGSGVLDRVIADVIENKKDRGKIQMVLSANTCLGGDDPDDVSGFMTKADFIWVQSYDDAFFEYGRTTEGLVFERDL